MASNRLRLRAATVIVIAAGTLGLVRPVVAIAGADTFTAMMDAAMATMDRAMMAPLSGDPDRDFAAMMIPHHQGAIDMAEAELRFGHDERLRRLAQAIIVEQRQEIVVMRDALASLPPAPPAGGIKTHASMPTMSMGGMQNPISKGH
ncbi:DUF305 domain-containing protein [Lichenibacterium minor]|uniref:DUF305 domain-containing protein n=1 Tax=Lichenibacterium minor TaxID=2316528 RepID=A0A4Q2U614_9HYPH|nr:DUF305 domain-containing protein [Lichenibacterium minor]RYC31278.1 DUF305 domain-containing protein [Lichenibacterium minor]